jgi:hypothetical protein
MTKNQNSKKNFELKPIDSIKKALKDLIVNILPKYRNVDSSANSRVKNKKYTTKLKEKIKKLKK